MRNDSLEEQIIQAIRAGNTTRQSLMAIDALRLRTWAVVNQQLLALTKRGVIVPSKAGWRLA